MTSIVQHLPPHSAPPDLADRYALAFQKNPLCVVCTKPLASPNGALLLERNDRLAHAGACSVEAIRHLFAFASRGLRGRRSLRGVS